MSKVDLNEVLDNFEVIKSENEIEKNKRLVNESQQYQDKLLQEKEKFISNVHIIQEAVNQNNSIKDLITSFKDEISPIETKVAQVKPSLIKGILIMLAIVFIPAVLIDFFTPAYVKKYTNIFWLAVMAIGAILMYWSDISEKRNLKKQEKALYKKYKIKNIDSLEKLIKQNCQKIENLFPQFVKEFMNVRLYSGVEDYYSISSAYSKLMELYNDSNGNYSDWKQKVDEEELYWSEAASEYMAEKVKREIELEKEAEIRQQQKNQEKLLEIEKERLNLEKQEAEDIRKLREGMQRERVKNGGTWE